MEKAIEVVKGMIFKLADQCEEYSLESNYTETMDKIEVLEDVIKKLGGN